VNTDLPYNAVQVEVDGALASFIGANGEVLGTRVVGSPRHWSCTACGCRCEAGSLSDRIPECHRRDPRADWSPVIPEQETQQRGESEVQK